MLLAGTRLTSLTAFTRLSITIPIVCCVVAATSLLATFGGLRHGFSTDLFRSRTWSAVRDAKVPHMGLRDTRHVIERAPEELYDIAEDPQETHNLIDDPAHSEVAKQMRQRLLDFRRRTDDPWLEIDFQQGMIDEIDPSKKPISADV